VRGDTYVFDPHISRAKGLGYWFGQKRRCYVAVSDGRIVGTYILKVVELAVPWVSIVCARLNASAFVQCNLTSSSLPTKLHYAFGKILDLELSGGCRAHFATPRKDLSMSM